MSRRVARCCGRVLGARGRPFCPGLVEVEEGFLQGVAGLKVQSRWCWRDDKAEMSCSSMAVYYAIYPTCLYVIAYRMATSCPGDQLSSCSGYQDNWSAAVLESSKPYLMGGNTVILEESSSPWQA